MAQVQERSDDATKWHQSKKFRNSIWKFHYDYTRCPRIAIGGAKRRLHKLIKVIINDYPLVSRVECTGSTYEGVKVGTTDLEFDLMLILTGFEKVATRAIANRPGYYTLTAEGAESAALARPEKVLNELYSHIAKRLQNRFPNVCVRSHGPAVQIDVSRGKSFGAVWFSVDIVPCIELRQGDATYRFVAKPPKGKAQIAEADAAWRKSYSVEEKEMIKGSGRNTVYKPCLRILKGIRDRDESLQHLNSYIFKTLIISNKQDISWSMRDIGDCVITILTRLANALEQGTLSHPFISDMNILRDFSQVTMDQTAARIRELLRSQVKFTTILTGGEP